MIRGIAFDWGGIFTEGTFDASAMAALAAAGQRSVDEVREPYLALMAEFEVGAFDLPSFRDRFAAATGVDLPLEHFRELFLGAVKDRDWMLRLLASIPDTYRVGMLSNNAPELCDRVRDDPRFARVERFVFSNEIAVRKPDPAAFRALAVAMELPPNETVFVDDAPANVEAARMFGFQAILLDTKASFVAAWRERLPDVDPLPGEEDAALGAALKPIRLLQGYLWHPKDLDLQIEEHLDQEPAPNVHVLIDEMPRAPFAFFDDGTPSESQRFYQLTVLTFARDEAEAERLVPWLAERLQDQLDATPEGVGWQVMEDLRPIE